MAWTASAYVVTPIGGMEAYRDHPTPNLIVLAVAITPIAQACAVINIVNGRGTWNATAATATVVVTGTGGHSVLGHIQCLDKSNRTVEVALNTGNVKIAADGSATNVNFALTDAQKATYTLAQNYHVLVQDLTDSPITSANGYLDVDATPSNVVAVGATIGPCSGPGFAQANANTPALPIGAQFGLATALLTIVLVRANRA